MSTPFVYVTRRVPSDAIDRLRRLCRVGVWDSEEVVPRRVLLEAVADADGLLCLLTERIEEELLRRAPRLRVVANMAVGYDNIDLAACTRHGVVATNTPDVLTETTADLAFALLLASARRVVEADRFVRQGRWRTWDPLLLLGRDVHGATLGIVGLGRIGTAVARRARGFDMRVLYHSARRRSETEAQLGLEHADLERLLRESDFVSIHVDLNPSTRHLLSSDRLRLMKPTAYLINTARGPIVDSEALYEALRQGQLAGAALDVTDPEPLPPDHPLLTLPNVTICPHIGSATVATRARMAALAADNLLAVFQGRRPPNPLNWEEARASAGSGQAPPA